MHSAALIQV